MISKWFGEDEDHAEAEEGEVVGVFAVAAGGDPSSCFQPGVGAFDWPAVAALGVVGFEVALAAPPDFPCRAAGRDRFARAAALADLGGDAALEEPCAVVGAVVAAVGPDLVWPDSLLDELVDER